MKRKVLNIRDQSCDATGKNHGGYSRQDQIKQETGDKSLPLKGKKKSYVTVVRPTMLYGFGWSHFERKKGNKNESCRETKPLRCMCGVTRSNKIGNYYV